MFLTEGQSLRLLQLENWNANERGNLPSQRIGCGPTNGAEQSVPKANHLTILQQQFDPPMIMQAVLIDNLIKLDVLEFLKRPGP